MKKKSSEKKGKKNSSNCLEHKKKETSELLHAEPVWIWFELMSKNSLRKGYVFVRSWNTKNHSKRHISIAAMYSNLDLWTFFIENLLNRNRYLMTKKYLYHMQSVHNSKWNQNRNQNRKRRYWKDWKRFSQELQNSLKNLTPCPQPVSLQPQMIRGICHQISLQPQMIQGICHQIKLNIFWKMNLKNRAVLRKM